MVRTQIQLTKAQYASLKATAEDTGSSLAELIRQAVDSWLQRSARLPREERIQRALAVCGQFHSAVPDLSERHDEYAFED